MEILKNEGRQGVRKGGREEGMNGVHSVNYMHTQFMFQYLEGISKVMIVDFDAHQVSLWSHDCRVIGVKGHSTHTLRCYTHTLHTHTHTYTPHTPHTLHRVMVMNEISLTITECLSWTCTTSGSTLMTEKLKVRGGGRREDVVGRWRDVWGSVEESGRVKGSVCSLLQLLSGRRLS